jgi:hypothetical protein
MHWVNVFDFKRVLCTHFWRPALLPLGMGSQIAGSELALRESLTREAAKRAIVSSFLWFSHSLNFAAFSLLARFATSFQSQT